MALNIGIDFGTSTIFVTRWNEKKKQPEAVPNITRDSSEKLIENVIYYETNNVILGEKAYRKGLNNPQNMVQYIKRGLEHSDWSATIENLNHKTLSALDVITDIFKFLKHRIEELHGNTKIESVVLSVPFAFNQQERNMIKLGAEQAGLNVLQLIEEPISAGISYGLLHQDDLENNADPKKILIFDLGGGTFDIAIFELSMENQQLNINVINTGGDKHLGGKDIDDIIFYKLLKILNLNDSDLSAKDRYDLKKEAKRLKENLSVMTEDEAILNLQNAQKTLESIITIEQFNQWLIEHQFIEKIHQALESSLNQIDIQPESIDHVILVGGSSNIPIIQKTVQTVFKRDVRIADNPAEMVGNGNAILAGSFNDPLFQSMMITYSHQHQKAETPNLPTLSKTSIATIEDSTQIILNYLTTLDDHIELINLTALRERYHSQKSKFLLNELSSILIQSLKQFDLKTLIASRCKIKSISESISELDCLTNLNLEKNDLIHLPESIKELNQLVTLKLGFNKLTDLSAIDFNFPKLTHLHLNNNKLNQLNYNYHDLNSLTYFDCSFNKLSELPETLMNLSQLNHLDCRFNQIKLLPTRTKQLTNLTYFDAHFNQIAFLPEDFGYLSNLNYLNLSQNLLRSLPSSFSRLTQLKHLDLSKNEIDELPDLRLRSLIYLNLNDNQLIELPSSLSESKDLIFLDIGLNKLSEIPKWISQFNHLMSLNIEHTQISEIPKWVGSFQNLTSLNIANNSLSYLPDYLANLTQLTYLNISGNELHQLPQWISRFSQLEYLNISGNRLGELPDWICEFKHLKVLIINNNPINQLPDQIGFCNQLEELELSCTQLQTLPNSMQDLKSLKKLDVSGNDLKVIPNWINHCKSLTDLDFSSNDISDLPITLNDLKNLLNLSVGKNDAHEIYLKTRGYVKSLSGSGEISPTSQNISILKTLQKNNPRLFINGLSTDLESELFN